jgi:hypothetical protein
VGNDGIADRLTHRIEGKALELESVRVAGHVPPDAVLRCSQGLRDAEVEPIEVPPKLNDAIDANVLMTFPVAQSLILTVASHVPTSRPPPALFSCAAHAETAIRTASAEITILSPKVFVLPFILITSHTDFGFQPNIVGSCRCVP